MTEDNELARAIAKLERRGWKPKLTPAKLRALDHLTTGPAPVCKGPILTSCHALELMGLVEPYACARQDRFSITPAGRKALADPISFKPFRV